MEWRDEGLIIGVRRHGEASTIVEAMTRAHGRHLGLVRGGRSARLRAALQPGNTVGLVWRARLDEHLGSFAVEPLALRAGRLMGSALALAGINYLAALVRVLPERDPHEAVYEAASLIAEALDSALAPTLIAAPRDAPARQYGRPRLARPARRAFGRLRRRASLAEGRAPDGEHARACGDQLSGRAHPFPARARSA